MNKLPILHGRNLQVNKHIDTYLDMFIYSDYNCKKLSYKYLSEFPSLYNKLNNAYFGGIDGTLYHAMVREYKPKNIIEVGSGFCTKIAFDAMDMNGFGNIISIDPHARNSVDFVNEQIKTKVEDVDINIFNRLQKNDFFFVDASHTKEEALYITENILPKLNKGVIIQFHDITFPYECGDESYVLLDYLYHNKDSFNIITGFSHVRYLNTESEDNNISYLYKVINAPGSIWILKTN